jgi:hypothetical protein
MPRIRLAKDLKYRVTRALNNLRKPGVGAVCFWCGHQYRIGEYTRETESDHLIECPEFPQEGKQQIQEAQRHEARVRTQSGHRLSRRRQALD